MDRELLEKLCDGILKTLESGMRWDDRKLSDDNIIVMALACGLPVWDDRSREVQKTLPLLALVGD